MAGTNPFEAGDARDLADFFKSRTTQLHGDVAPCDQAGALIESFLNRHGDSAWLIVRYVLGPLGGMWRGAPVTVRRLAASQDDYFARPLMEALGI